MKWAILKKVRPGAGTDEGEITVNSEHVAAIEEEPGCGGVNTRLTLTGGREVCVRGAPLTIRAALIEQRRAEPTGMFSENFIRDFFGMRRA